MGPGERPIYYLYEQQDKGETKGQGKGETMDQDVWKSQGRRVRIILDEEPQGQGQDEPKGQGQEKTNTTEEQGTSQEKSNTNGTPCWRWTEKKGCHWGKTCNYRASTPGHA